MMIHGFVGLQHAAMYHIILPDLIHQLLVLEFLSFDKSLHGLSLRQDMFLKDHPLVRFQGDHTALGYFLL